MAFGEVAIVGCWDLQCYLAGRCQLIVGWLIGQSLVGLSGDLRYWSQASLVSSRISWSSVPLVDEDVGSFSLDDTMVQLHNTAKWHNGAMRWYNEMIRW